MSDWKPGIPNRPIAPRVTMPSPFMGTNYELASLADLTFDEKDAGIILNWLKNPQDILFIYSAPGIGKTHLCAAITHFFLDKQKPCLYLKEKTFIERLRQQIAEGFSEEHYMKYLCENSFIILDDICSTRNNSDTSSMTDWQKDMLFTFLDYRVNSRLPTIITSNYSLEQIGKMFHERFVSRLSAARNTILLLKGMDKRKEIL